jgi:hypothetical protein
VKFDLFINGVRLESWAEAEIVLDSAYNSSARFSVRAAGNGSWLDNLSKVKISGRDCRPETASWGFEELADLADWWLAGLADAGIDPTQSAYGIGSWRLNWTEGVQTARIYQAPARPANMHGLVFWGWLNLAYQTTFRPQVTVQAYARDGAGTEWSSGLIALPESSAWNACGLRIAPTNAVEAFPTAITEWGFRLRFTESVPANLKGQLLFVVHLDSVELCGRAYPQSLLLPPFPPAVPLGSLQPAVTHPCAKYDQAVYADELHVKPTDAGYCGTAGIYDQSVYASDSVISPQDAQYA